MNNNDLPHAAESRVTSSDLFGLPWVGELSHDRSQNADWGVLRDERGHLIYQCGAEKGIYSDYAAECRRNGTDPCQSRVDVILRLLAVANAAMKIRHWHCSGKDGMVVSKQAVHDLWESLQPFQYVGPNRQTEGQGSNATTSTFNQ